MIHIAVHSVVNSAANLAQKYMGEVQTVVRSDYNPDPSGKKMKALAWFGVEDVRLVDVPVPDITEPDDAIIRVTGTTICGSDLHLYHAEVAAMQKGDILGHEFMGVVEKVGQGVRNIKPGLRVVASFHIACGECEYCQQKLTAFCDRTNNSSLMNYMYGQRDAGMFGYSHLTGGFPGGQAEYVRVPKADVNLLPIPDSVPDEKALYLSDILPTSYHAVVDTGVNEGDVVGIWGLGPIGLCSAKWAQLKGASRIIGIDKYPDRLEFGQKKLGIETINFEENTDVGKRIYQLVPRGLDVALNCATPGEPKTLYHKILKALMLETDTPEALNEMLVSTRKVGRCGLTGDNIGYANRVNIGALMEKGIRTIGNGQAPVAKYWEEILYDYIMTDKFNPAFIVTHRVPLEDMPKLYKAFDKRAGGVVKVFVETKFSSPPSPGFPQTSRVQDWAKV